MKILYAAGNNEGGQIALSRFVQAMQNSRHQLKLAAFRKSSPPNVSISWTLDCLLNMKKPNRMSMELSDNDNLEIYYQQIKYYRPDLIISDMEQYTSYIADVLNIPLWHCSSSLLHPSLQQDKTLPNIFANFAFLLERNNALKTQRLYNTIANSQFNFVYSHFGDTINAPKLKSNFQWIRPYHQLGKISVPCRHNIVAGMLKSNKKILSFLKRQDDCVAFCQFPYEHYSSLTLKNIQHEEEYFCNVKNCKLFICQGQSNFLADAFYNNKYVATFPDFQDIECVVNSTISNHLQLSSTIHEPEEDLNILIGKQVQPQFNNNIKLLHEKIEEIYE